MPTYTTTLSRTFEACDGASIEAELHIVYSVCDGEPEIEDVQVCVGGTCWMPFNGDMTDDDLYYACLDDMLARKEDAEEAQAEHQLEMIMLGE